MLEITSPKIISCCPTADQEVEFDLLATSSASWSQMHGCHALVVLIIVSRMVQVECSLDFFLDLDQLLELHLLLVERVSWSQTTFNVAILVVLAISIEVRL